MWVDVVRVVFDDIKKELDGLRRCENAVSAVHAVRYGGLNPTASIRPV